ncbi:hypothetical protein FH972_024079 [Carpinus fangiana]|uniref:Uncharacterized protein n=1 Tax=Carpinus fangiana TaxID=176857 RepID=A0A5N6KXA7_9ROSI|nr:hypothetical protein FH972_024079 [Carpinus fangiana]
MPDRDSTHEVLSSSASKNPMGEGESETQTQAQTDHKSQPLLEAGAVSDAVLVVQPGATQGSYASAAHKRKYVSVSIDVTAKKLKHNRPITPELSSKE